MGVIIRNGGIRMGLIIAFIVGAGLMWLALNLDWGVVTNPDEWRFL